MIACAIGVTYQSLVTERSISFCLDKPDHHAATAYLASYCLSCASNAQTMRAVLLAYATAATLGLHRPITPASQQTTPCALLLVTRLEHYE